MNVNKILQKDVVILGGGLAGLACADELVRKSGGKLKVLVLEKADHIGGLAATFKYDGFRFDLAPHRWFTKNDELNQWIDELMAKEMIWVEKNTPMYQHGKFYRYPIEIGDVLKKVGLLKAVLMVGSYLWARLSQKIRPGRVITMKDAYASRFGYILFKWFNEEYNNKLWGVGGCEKMSADFVDQRTKELSVATIIKNALGLSEKIISLTPRFRFPRLGIGRISENLGKRIHTNGGEIKTGVTIAKITKDKGGYQVFTNQGTFGCQQLVSSIPIDELVKLIQPSVPPAVIRAVDHLAYVSQKIVIVLVNKPRLTPFTWVYVHPQKIPFFRFLETNNWSKEMSPAGKTSLVFEYPYQPGDKIEKISDRELIEQTINDFISFFSPKTQNPDIIKSYVFIVNKAYPKYDLHYKKSLKFIKDHLFKSYPGLQLIGRNGMFRYNNMDHSVLTGILAAKNIIIGKKVYNVENVNNEAEYQEEKRV